MDPDALKAAWQALDRHLTLNNRVTLELRNERKLKQVRGHLRPLFFGQLLQILFGVGLISLGIACWTRNIGDLGFLVSGIIVHVFGIVNVVTAGITLGLMSQLDYSAPVVAIQKRFAWLKQFYLLNAIVCGQPWWFMWLFLIISFVGLGHWPRHAAAAVPPLWIWINLAICMLGLLMSWGFYYWARNFGHSRLADAMRDMLTGASLRRAQARLDELERFELE